MIFVYYNRQRGTVVMNTKSKEIKKMQARIYV